MVGIVIDTISNRTIYCKDPFAIARDRVLYHNSMFAYKFKGMHYPQDAYYQVEADAIYIKRR